MNNRLAEFAVPVMRNYDLYVYRNLVVSGYGRVKDNFIVDGDETVDGNVKVGGNVNVDGYVLAKTFLPGQIINVSMFSNTDLGQNSLTVAAGATNNVFTISFTPKYSNSYLIVEYQTVYTLIGAGSDAAEAYLHVNDGADNRISRTFQQWNNSQGGGTRSGVLFPLIGRYTNTNTSTKAIRVDLYNHTDADPLSVANDVSTWLKITEIGR
jgi:hypothetical protein